MCVNTYIYISIQHVYPNISKLPTNKINPKFQDFEAQYWCACVYFGAFVKFVKNKVSTQWNFVSCLREWMRWTDFTGSWKKKLLPKNTSGLVRFPAWRPQSFHWKTVFLRSTVPGGTNLADLRLTCHRGAHLPCSLRGRILKQCRVKTLWLKIDLIKNGGQLAPTLPNQSITLQ